MSARSFRAAGLLAVRGRTGSALLLLCLLNIGTAHAQTQTPWPSEFPPRPLAARDVQFPAYEVRTLPNGLQVVAVLHHEQPVVSMRMLVRAGSALDPKGKLGLANVAASLLDQGTTTKSAREMNDAIDFIGGEMGAGAGVDLTYVNTVVMKDSFETGLQMLSDMARHPAFAQDEIERLRLQMISGLKVSVEDPEFIADGVFNRLVYGFHPYGQPETGTPETLTAISRDDLLAYHRRNFVPNNAILAIVGDVTADEAFEGVRRVFGDWDRRDVPASSFIAPPQPTRRVIVVNKPDAVQTEVRMGHVGLRRNHPDYMALNLAVRILGGEGANRLHQILRTDRGLTYGAQADMHALKDSGDIEAETNTRSDATGEVVRLIVDQMWRLQRERVNERELADAKAYLTGSFPLTIETPDAIATQVLNVLFYGLPVEQLQSFRDRVNAVSVLDVERVAQKYLMPDRLSIVLVGNAAAFTSQLRGAGFGTYETVDMNDLDLTTADFRKPRGRADATGAAPDRVRGVRVAYQLPPASPASSSSASSASSLAASGAQTISAREGSGARALLDQIIAAKGGQETLRAIKGLSASTRSEMSSPSGNIKAEVVTYLQYPNRVRVETTVAGATVVQIYDGVRGWMTDGSATREVTPQMIRDLEAGFQRDTVVLMLAAYDGRVRPRLLPDVKDETGRRFHALELSSVILEPIVLYIDPDTHLVAKQTYVAGGAGGPVVEELFSDYQMVDGVQIAFTAKVRRGGQPVLDRRITAIAINPPIDPRLFTRPAS